MKCILINIEEYFEREAKKNKTDPKILGKYATGKNKHQDEGIFISARTSITNFPDN